ncbi:MAG: response regulator [Sphingomonas sp.]
MAADKTPPLAKRVSMPPVCGSRSQADAFGSLVEATIKGRYHVARLNPACHLSHLANPYPRCFPTLCLGSPCHHHSGMTVLRILVAEDDAMIAMFLSDLLEVLGHKICALTDTEAGTVAAALLHRPDLMIIDEGLRDGSGIAAVQNIETTLPVPHIFATGDCYRVLSAEPHAIVLQKPFNAPALIGAIERAMEPVADAKWQTREYAQNGACCGNSMPP